MPELKRTDSEVIEHLKNSGLLIDETSELAETINEGIIHVYRKGYIDGYNRSLYDFKIGKTNDRNN